MFQRSVELFASVDRVLSLHDDYMRSPADYPDQDYWDAVDAMVKTYANGALPTEARAMQRVVEAMATKLRDMDVNGRWEPNRWSNLVADLKVCRDRDLPRTDFKRLEPIATLVEEQNVPYWQVAKMYGLVDRQTGEPLRELAEREHRHPGSVLGRQYPHPDQERLDYAEGFLSAYAAYSAAHGVRQIDTPEQLSAKAQAERPFCPESWEELFALTPPVSIQQLMAMKGATEAEVLDEARRCGSIPHLPVHEQALVQQTKARQERARKEQDHEHDKQAIAEANNGGQADPERGNGKDGPGDEGNGAPKSIEEQIIELAEQGKEHQEIKAATGAAINKIKETIRAHQAKKVAAAAGDA